MRRYFATALKVNWVCLSQTSRFHSWLKLIFKFEYKNCDIILSDGVEIIALLLKWFSIGRIELNGQLASFMIIYLSEGKYKRRTSILLKYCLNSYDRILCNGPIQYEYAKKIITNKKVKLSQHYNGIGPDRYEQLLNFSPDYSKLNLVSIGHCKNSISFHVKGMDIMIKAFLNLNKIHEHLRYYIIGDVNPEELNSLKKKFPSSNWNNIIFCGFVEDLIEVFKNCTIYIHLSRYDAWPTSVAEASLAGLVPIVSDRVGSKEVVSHIKNPDLIISVNEINLINAVENLIKLPLNELKLLGDKAKISGSRFSMERAVTNYKKCFYG